jgi:hypothetical protein
VLNRRHKAGIPLSTSELELLFPNGYDKTSEERNEFHDVNLEKLPSQAMHGYGSILKEKEKDINASQSKSNMITSSIALSDVQETNEDSTNMNSNSSSNSSLPWSSSSFMNQFEALKSKTLKSELGKNKKYKI